MTIADDASDAGLWYALNRLEIGYWWEVDHNGGGNAYQFYLPDGVYEVGENRFVGLDRIRAFYAWRMGRGPTTTRHVISNLHVVSADERGARLIAVLSLFRANGRPPIHATRPPCLVADITGDCVRGEDGKWRYRSHVVRPVFVGSDIPLSLSIDTQILADRERELVDHST
jgi:hypothetical protein